MKKISAALAPALVLAAAAGCFGTGTKRVDAACREMRSTVVYEMLRDNPSIRLVDLRRPMEVTPAERRLANAMEIPLEKLPARLPELGASRERPVVVFGRFGDEGRRGCEFLAGNGFRWVVYVADGAEGWFKNGLPGAPPPPTPAPEAP